MAQAAAAEAARMRDDVADIINAVIEELVRRRFELPAFGTLAKIATAARAAANRDCHRHIANTLPTEARRRLNELLTLPPGQARTAWDRVKAEPKRSTPHTTCGISCTISTGCGRRAPAPQCSPPSRPPKSAALPPRRAP
ncbi:DUF4158 domain-containing protein [Azospirillum thiophilum]|uniref:DUF4158 domain-containing protein n=1 Tax=Azospirillum thiophilum TaxID=528244 RepID=UPI0009E2B000|nr:DUF4158 domain-containing protein [Azospirillum thiophilum]